MSVKWMARVGFGVVAATATLAHLVAVGAEDQKNGVSRGDAQMGVNIPTWTLGGKQFWTDELIHGSWRIQRNVLSNHYRLLDPNNIRRGWGSWKACLARWKRVKREEEIGSLDGSVVILLHGLGRSRSSMKSMAQYLETHGAFTVLNFSYASTRCSLDEDAESLARVVRHLENVERISFVAHSMGNLVVRHLLDNQLAPSRDEKLDQRLGRIVMLAPPNNGAALAKRFQNNPLFQLIFGKGGRQFTKDWTAVRKRLVTPPCQFGIIAGNANGGQMQNPLLKGNDDLIVTVEETRLPGARDFVVVPKGHTFIMDDETVQEYTLCFLEHGYFISEKRRQPIRE